MSKRQALKLLNEMAAEAETCWDADEPVPFDVELQIRCVEAAILKDFC
jgi:hypothetical protein